MAPQPAMGQKARPTPKKAMRGLKRKRDEVGTEQLQAQVAELDATAAYTSFDALPLSDATRAGLKAAAFSTPTDIQAQGIPHALKGRDILGAAKTGSGKTLAFLVPTLENLHRAQCVGPDAGLSAMIISPTRELAMQIFDVLRKVGGKGHLFAAGLVIGGKSLREERDALSRMNIVVCTPGRILQHLSQTATFNADNLRMLVLDEADRIMDMGFQTDVDAIVEYLPPNRQTLLFSATQTKRVSDLSRLALREPEYISVHEAAISATPKTLQQNYCVTPLPEKLDTLWSFLQSSKKSKILVFLSSGKQVRFVYESFRHMQPGIPLLHLHGRQKQTARLEVTQKFSQAKYSCLFATDVVARGLDFPAVDWVIQVDCPEDADTYIHRVGRTARYEKSGRAVLFLDPSEEEGMLTRLEAKKVPIERINVRAKKQSSIKSQLQSMCFKDPSLKYTGQRAFASYVRSLYVQKDKAIFRLEKYPLKEFAASLGLPGAPRIKFLKVDQEEVKKRKNAPRMGADVEDLEGLGNDGDGEKSVKAKNGLRTKYDRMFERQNQDILADHYQKMVRNDDEKDDTDMHRLDGGNAGEDDDLFDVKRRIPAGEAPSPAAFDDDDLVPAADSEQDSYEAKSISIAGAKTPLVLDSKRREKLLKSKKKLLKLKDKGSKLVFDDDGTAHPVYELEDEKAFHARGPIDDQRNKFLRDEASKVAEADKSDKAFVRERRRVKKEMRKERERAEAESEDAAGGVEGRDEDALANFLADAASKDGTPEPKRQKKWFEGRGKRKDLEEAEDLEIGTLEGLEAEAERLLG